MFQYSPLDPDKNQIRLIYPERASRQKVRPSVENEEVGASGEILPTISRSFKLQIVSLDDKPEYTALSYVWGDQTNGQERISINGADSYIGANLNDALRHLQYDDIKPAIWIDAICIDQRNMEEKNDQVPRMRAIYSQARNVAIWLGPATENTKVIADILHTFRKSLTSSSNFSDFIKRLWCRVLKRSPRTVLAADRFLRDHLRPKNKVPSYWGNCETEDTLKFLGRIIKMTPHASSAFSSPEKLIIELITFITSREWLKRVWTIQEMVLAREYYYQCGAYKLPANELEFLTIDVANVSKHMVVFWHKDVINLQNKVKRESSYHFLHRYWLHIALSERSKAPPAFFDILSMFYTTPTNSGETHELSAANPKDRIYGLLGLIEDEMVYQVPLAFQPYWGFCLPGNFRTYANKVFQNLGVKDLELTVDYSRSCSQLFVEVAQQLISAGYLDVFDLCESERNTNSDKPLKLPSWAPDWSHSILSPADWWTSIDDASHILHNRLFSASGSTCVKANFTTLHNGQLDTLTNVMYIHGLPIDEVAQVKSTYLKLTIKDNGEKMLSQFQILLNDIMELVERSKQIGQNVYPKQLLHEATWRIPIWDTELNYHSTGYRRGTDFSKKPFELTLKRIKTLNKNHQEGQKPLTFNDLYDHRCPIIGTKNAYLDMALQGTSVAPFITKKGYIGLAPSNVEVGDTVCVLYGANVPHVLHKRKEQQPGHVLIGSAFVYGMMDGEAMKLGREEETFEIF